MRLDNHIMICPEFQVFQVDPCGCTPHGLEGPAGCPFGGGYAEVAADFQIVSITQFAIVEEWTFCAFRVQWIFP